jgi:hypothetical protein
MRIAILRLAYPLSLRDAYTDVGGRATHGAVAERLGCGDIRRITA